MKIHFLHLLSPVSAWSLEGFPGWAARHVRTTYLTASNHMWPASNIPQFILDANHPWISDNRPRLERYPDNIGSALCTPNSSLWTDLDPPPDLFHDLEINNNRAGISRLGWANAIDRLREMLACPTALNDVRHLSVDIYVHDSSFSHYSEPTLPPSELPALFVEALRRMPNLECLKWGISAQATWTFQKEFARQNLTLPSVRCLVPGKYSDYLVRMCPGLEELRAGGYTHHWSWRDYIAGTDNDADLMLIRSAGSAENLTMLELHPSRWEGWTPDLLKEILIHMPNIKTLRMNGKLSVKNQHDSYYFWDDVQWRQRGATLQRYLDILVRFPHLEYLHLPSSPDLDLGFDGGAWCGNAYFGVEGREYGRQIVKEGAETVEFAGDMVVKTLPHLKGLSIGELANITHGNEELPQVSWPWTGRMEEYALEQYPL